MSDLISIIVPVYNIDNYIEYCIKSLICQTYKNLEIILINDASSDKSLEVCRKYAKKDSRICIINNKKNYGAGTSRNMGLDRANGKYILFVDGDDFVAKNYIEELYKLIKVSNSQIAMCSVKKTYYLKRNKQVEENTLAEFYEIMDSESAIKNLCHQRKIIPGPMVKLIEKEAFKNVRFPDTGYEDLALIYNLLHEVKRIAFSPKEKYYYVQRKNNTTLGQFNEKKMDRLRVVEDMRTFININYPQLVKDMDVRCFLAQIQTLNVLPLHFFSEKYLNDIKKNIKKYRKSVLLNSDAKFSIRIMALSSYLGVYILKCLGLFYNIICGYYKVKLK